MDSIHSWIDAEEVRRLAESLTATPEKRQLLEKVEQESSAELEHEHLVEAPRELPAEVIERQRSSLADASAMANTAGLINSMRGAEPVVEQAAENVVEAASVQQPVVTPVQVVDTEQAPQAVEPAVTGETTHSSHAENTVVSPSGTFVDVERLFSESVQAQGICAVDRDGDVLFDSLNNPALSGFVVAILENSSVFDVAEGEVRNTRLKTYADQVVEFVAVRSTRGVVVVAALLEKGMNNAQVNEIGVKLVQTLNS